ncbi:MAG: hypothetical protein M1820_005687 [Bogoriella megaspora]|nr:MAG: hypothetical protein M1820_005687 [Bogoriella megaspora]
MTLAGLNTVNLSEVNTWQQVMLFTLIVIGSAIFVSAFVVHVRRKAFETKFRDVLEKRSRFGRLGHNFSITRTRSPPRTLANSQSLPLSRRGNEKDFEKEDDDGSFRGRPVSKSLDLSNGISGVKMTSTSMSGAADPTKQRDDAKRETGGPSLDEKLLSTSAQKDSIGPQSNSVEASASASETISPSRGRIPGITFSPNTHVSNTHGSKPREEDSQTRRKLSMNGVGAQSATSLRLISPLPPVAFSGVPGESDSPTGKPSNGHGKFPLTGSMGRNSQFHGLSVTERERLGGREYRAIQFLSILVPLYFVLWQLLGCIGLGAYVNNNRPDTARANGLNPWWVGIFNGASAFNNSGMSLLDANMTAFQTSYYMLLTMGAMILAGNTAYPIFLRLIVWTLWKWCPDNDAWHDWKETLRFLLDHPRRCYTNLFPSQHTWWLLLALVILNGGDWIMFEVLNIGNSAITQLDAGTEVVDGLFQAFAVRSGGFYVVPISSVRVSLQVLYVVMMYISVYPVVITMRNSNVYEERSLGIYANDPPYEPVQSKKSSGLGLIFGGLKRHLTGGGFTSQQEGGGYFVRQQLRAQLAHDAWFLAFAVFLISIIEGGQFEKDPATFSVLNIIFEVVSGYACVGISVGLPYAAYSFCGSWHALSKVILCFVMIRGRHRGLPVAIDKAVLLPGEHSDREEEEDAQIRMDRSVSRGSVV